MNKFIFITMAALAVGFTTNLYADECTYTGTKTATESHCKVNFSTTGSVVAKVTTKNTISGNTSSVKIVATNTKTGAVNQNTGNADAAQTETKISVDPGTYELTATCGNYHADADTCKIFYSLDAPVQEAH